MRTHPLIERKNHHFLPEVLAIEVVLPSGIEWQRLIFGEPLLRQRQRLLGEVELELRRLHLLPVLLDERLQLGSSLQVVEIRTRPLQGLAQRLRFGLKGRKGKIRIKEGKEISFYGSLMGKNGKKGKEKERKKKVKERKKERKKEREKITSVPFKRWKKHCWSHKSKENSTFLHTG